MPARVLTLFALIQALALVAPPLSWPLWKLRFGAIEGCLLGVVVGCVAVALTKERWVAVAAAASAVVCLTPALRAVPAYLAEGRAFSLVEWVTGRTTPAGTVERGLVLGPTVTADLWRGAGEGPRPAVVVVHGGSWRSGAPGEVLHVSAALAAAGYTVVDVGYRLSEEAPFPAGIGDVRCALVALAADPARFGIDPTRIALLGRSAGAQMALVAAYADETLAPSCAGALPPVRAVVSLYGPTDMAWAHDTPYVPDVVDGVAAIEIYLGGTPASAPERYRAATPQTWVRPGLPATLLLHGTSERCVRPENATRLNAALVDAGVPVRTVLVPGADHGFDVRPGGFGEQLARGVVLDFLRDALR